MGRIVKIGTRNGGDTSALDIPRTYGYIRRIILDFTAQITVSASGTGVVTEHPAQYMNKIIVQANGKPIRSMTGRYNRIRTAMYKQQIPTAGETRLASGAVQTATVVRGVYEIPFYLPWAQDSREFTLPASRLNSLSLQVSQWGTVADFVIGGTAVIVANTAILTVYAEYVNPFSDHQGGLHNPKTGLPYVPFVLIENQDITKGAVASGAAADIVFTKGKSYLWFLHRNSDTTNDEPQAYFSNADLNPPELGFLAKPVFVDQNFDFSRHFLWSLITGYFFWQFIETGMVTRATPRDTQLEFVTDAFTTAGLQDLHSCAVEPIQYLGV